MSTPSAFVFDAYAALFDVHSVAAVAGTIARGHGKELAGIWRAKQVEYTWLQSLMTCDAFGREHFDGVTAHALDYAVAALTLPLQSADRQRQLGAYRARAALPEAHRALGALAFGFVSYWINRAGAPIDRRGPRPDHVLASLADLVRLGRTRGRRGRPVEARVRP
jgi:hypothetical protein